MRAYRQFLRRIRHWIRSRSAQYWWRILVLAAVAVALIVEAGVLVRGKKASPAPHRADLSQYVREVIKKCAAAKYHPGCYDEEIPKLMDVLSLNQAFAVTSEVQNQDSSYQYCHVLGHKLSAREVQKDMSKWKEIIAECPTGLCANGCLHGAFQERFRAESLTPQEIQATIPELRSACEERANWHPTGLEQATCYHGLGHLAMEMTGGEIPQSLKLCDDISLPESGRDYRTLCYEGLFMQLFQPLEPEDFALVKGKAPTKSGLLSYCRQFAEKVRSDACFAEGWPLYREEIGTPAGLTDFCNTPKNLSSRDRCFFMLFHVVGQGANFDIEKIKTFCASRKLTRTRRDECFANAASSIVQADKRFVDKVIGICAWAKDQGFGQKCYDSLAEFAAYNLKSGSPEFLHLCNSLPESWKNKCLPKI